MLPIVNQVEGQWIGNFETRSPFVAIGSTASSSLGSRPFVESMCHDRWTSVSGWLNAPNFEQPLKELSNLLSQRNVVVHSWFLLSVS